MIKFLLQTIEGKVKHDFVFGLEQAIEYQNWRGNDMCCKYCSLEDITHFYMSDEDLEDYVPVGTVQFVLAYIDRFILKRGGFLIRPLNVPVALQSYAGRHLCDHVIDDESREGIYEHWKGKIGEDGSMFVKSNERIKSKVNDFYYAGDLLDKDELPDGEYQISSRIDIISEYRCFVYNDRLVGIQYYSGDFTVFPDVRTIEYMLSEYRYDYGNGNAPQAFTLDVAVTSEGKTVVMEVHEFFSCGLYGFDDYTVLPYMFVRTFNDIKNRLTSVSQK